MRLRFRGCRFIDLEGGCREAADAPLCIGKVSAVLTSRRRW